jgi:malonate transporter and related proteins
MLFVPALLFRTMARLDLGALPWRLIAAYFVPAVIYTLLVYASQKRAAAVHGLAAPATRAASATYGNAVQLGIPLSAALFGEVGLGIHISLVSVHGLLLLVLLTVLAETDLARGRSNTTLAATIKQTARQAVLHPVVLPILVGLGWNLAGLPIPQVVDEVLVTLGAAVVPVCLVLIGISLQAYGLPQRWGGALGVTAAKLLLLPAAVGAVAYGLFGLRGVPLAVLVMMAALPVGANPLTFAQRYQTLEGETTAAIVISTVAFVATALGWLAVLAVLG